MDMPRYYEMGRILRGTDEAWTGPLMRVQNGTKHYWIPAREHALPNFRKRVMLAWKVFTGELDAIDSRK